MIKLCSCFAVCWTIWTFQLSKLIVFGIVSFYTTCYRSIIFMIMRLESNKKNSWIVWKLIMSAFLFLFLESKINTIYNMHAIVFSLTEMRINLLSLVHIWSTWNLIGCLNQCGFVLITNSFYVCFQNADLGDWANRKKKCLKGHSFRNQINCIWAIGIWCACWNRLMV